MMKEQPYVGYASVLEEVLNGLRDLEAKLAPVTFRDIRDFLLDRVGSASEEMLERGWMIEAMFLSHLYKRIVDLINEICIHIISWEAERDG
ncbi:MAG: hypothetical protein QXH20_02195 [Candidatus Bathyarchaeia archaeon]